MKQGSLMISISVLVPETPVIEILSPTTNQQYYSDYPIVFSALISDMEDDIEDLISVWISNIDGELTLNTEPNIDGLILGETFLSEGEHIITLNVEDSTGSSSTEEVSGPNRWRKSGTSL